MGKRVKDEFGFVADEQAQQEPDFGFVPDQEFKTKLNQDEEVKFQDWRKKLPSNLQEDTDVYDLRGAWKAGLTPDEDGHLPSRDPKSGLILKNKTHPTFSKTVEGEQQAGYELFEKNGRTYSRPKKKDSASPSASVSAQVGGPSVESTQKNTGTAKDRLKNRIDTYKSVSQSAFNEEAQPIVDEESKKIKSQIEPKFNDWLSVRKSELEKTTQRSDVDKANELFKKEQEEKWGSLLKEVEPQYREQVNQRLKPIEDKYNADLDKWMGIYTDQFQKEDFQENKETNPLKSLGKNAWVTLSKDLPSQAYGARALVNSAFKKMDESIIEGAASLLESAGIIDKKPEIKQEGATAIIIKDIKKSIALSKAGEENKKYLVNSLDKIKDGDFVDWMNYAGSAIGQGIGQIPASIGTKGASSLVQQMGSIYMDSVQKIAKEEGLTVEEVIKQGKDDVIYPLIFGVGTGLLDAIGAKGVVGSMTKSQVMNGFRQRALGVLGAAAKGGGVESLTEATQTALEQIGVGKAQGKSWHETLKNFDWEPLKDAALQGGIAGMFLSGSGKTIQSMTAEKPETVQIKPINVETLGDVTGIQPEKVEIKEPTPITLKPDQEAIERNKVQNLIDQQDGDITQTDDTAGVQNIHEAVGQTIEEGQEGNVEEREGALSDDSQITTMSSATEGDMGQPISELTEREKKLAERYKSLTPEDHAKAAKTYSDKLADDPQSEKAKMWTELQQLHTKLSKDDTQNTQAQQPESTTTGVVEQPTDGKGQPEPEIKTEGRSEDIQETGSIALDQPEDQKLSGIKKALVSQKKIDATPIERRSTEEMLTKAKEQVDSGEINPKAVVDEIANGDARALQPDEVAGLVYYKTQLDNKSDQLNSKLIDAIESGDVESQTRLRSELDVVDREIDNYNTMSVKTAYEQSLAFRLRQMLLDNEYNLQSQINKYKAANNGKISPEIEKKFKELDAQLKAANAKLKKLEEKQELRSSSEALTIIRQDLQRQKERRAKIAQQRKEKINNFFDSLKIKSDPNKLNSITQVIGESVYNGSIEAIRLAVLAGSDVATAIQAGVDYIRENYRGTDFDEQQYKSAVQPGLEKIVPHGTESAVPEIRNGKLHIPESVIRSAVEGGAKDINEVVDFISEMLKESDVSKREIRDAITRYGETRSLSKDEISAKLREIKRVGRLISALEDVQNKVRPLRSGLQRDKLTDQERRLQRDIKEAMKDLPVDQAEIDKAWKNALDAVKSRLKNQISDLERQIETGEKAPKKAGIKYDEEALALKEQRDKLKSVVEQIEGRPKMSDEQRTRMAVSAVEKTIADLESRIKNQDTSSRQKTSTIETQQLKDLRAQRDTLREQYQQMEKDMGVADRKKLEMYKSSLKKSTARYEQRIKDQDFETKKKQPITPDEEAMKLKLERDKIKQQFDLEREKVRLANRPMSEKIWDTVQDVWNLPKSFLASIDMSAPFRQGALLSISNPKAGAASFAEMFRQAFSENKANEWLLKLKESPEYAVMKQSKLYLAEPTTKLTAKEEQFLSNLAGRIPVIGKAVKASERAYTGYLNKLRVDVFAIGVDQLQQQGITPENNPEAYKSWANFINNATGRGNLGGMEMAAPILNGLFFSPRYVASRINLLNPVTYAKMPAPVRKMALKNFASYLAFGTVVLLLASIAGADVEEDPRSSDFGKIRIGDTRFDIWAGFQQVVRLMAQLITGQRKSTKTGEITELDKDVFPYETRGDVALRFFRSKLSPSAGTMANVMTGENIVGEDVTVQSEVVKNVVPLYLQDIKGIYDEEGATGVITSMVPAFFGIGVQSYGEKSGLTNKELDPDSEIQKLNKSRKYSIAQTSKSDLSESLDHEVDDATYDKYFELRDKEIKRLFDRYKGRLESESDIQIYDKLMDQIVKEAGREAKYRISREKGWRDTAKEFNPGDPFRLRNYKKNEEGKVVPR